MGSHAHSKALKRGGRFGLKYCPICNTPLTLFTIMRALTSTRLRCPLCRRRLKVLPANRLNLCLTLAYLLLACLSLLIGLKIGESLQHSLLSGILIYLFICIPLVELLAAYYIQRNPALRIACVNLKRMKKNSKAS
jgi:uncharacterized protein YbaR (Trm112 family)